MGKGRSKYLIEKRNEALCLRFYYWTEVQRIRFDDVIKRLSEKEFFVSERIILSIIRDKYDRNRHGAEYKNSK